jgi:hypothetical protein
MKSQEPKNPHAVKHTIQPTLPAHIFDLTVGCGPTLRCPVCGESFSHVQGVYTLLGGDESDGLYWGSYLVARETPYRRDAIAVRVHGETCNHRWDVVFQQHKGVTIVRIDVLDDLTTGAALKERRY